MRIKKAPATKAESAVRLISKPEVLDRVGVTFPTIWKWMREGKFPRSRQLGGKSCWIESEVEAWINALPVRRLKGDDRAACCNQ
jgi:prophage regulatory protein